MDSNDRNTKDRRNRQNDGEDHDPIVSMYSNKCMKCGRQTMTTAWTARWHTGEKVAK